MKKWIEAGGPYQFPFMGAAGRSLRGEGPIECPKCRQAVVRAYFHVFDPSAGTGTIWVWCPSCRTKCHLYRVTPDAPMGTDPFAHLSLDEFEALELDRDEPFFDRLERLWNEGKLPHRALVRDKS